MSSHSAASSRPRESTTVDAGHGIKLDTRLFKPPPSLPVPSHHPSISVVLVHPYTVLGGFQGLLRGIASGLADRGFPSVTFDMRGAGKSSGRPSLTGSAEVDDVVAVCNWVAQELRSDAIVLVGSSAGAPIAGSAVDKVPQVIGYISIGYPFGMMASVLFGRHHDAILRSQKPKLFIMGTKDVFTSVNQLENKLKSASGRADMHLVEGAGHFQMEGPAFDSQMVDLIVNFISSLETKGTAGDSHI